MGGKGRNFGRNEDLYNESCKNKLVIHTGPASIVTPLSPACQLVSHILRLHDRTCWIHANITHPTQPPFCPIPSSYPIHPSSPSTYPLSLSPHLSTLPPSPLLPSARPPARTHAQLHRVADCVADRVVSDGKKGRKEERIRFLSSKNVI